MTLFGTAALEAVVGRTMLESVLESSDLDRPAFLFSDGLLTVQGKRKIVTSRGSQVCTHRDPSGAVVVNAAVIGLDRRRRPSFTISFDPRYISLSWKAGPIVARWVSLSPDDVALAMTGNLARWKQ